MTSDQMMTCLWFDEGQARAAAEFYAATFPDSHVGASMHAPGDFPSGRAGDELTVEFTVLNRASCWRATATPIQRSPSACSRR